jgi:hypothetical protein
MADARALYRGGGEGKIKLTENKTVHNTLKSEHHIMKHISNATKVNNVLDVNHKKR